MEAKYHIITDLQCRVLHFGKEIAIASPNEDCLINLLKGRHLLSFVSTENELDKYSITFEVPDNDIEDFIDISLSSYRDERVAREEELKREEQQRRIEEARTQAIIRKKQEEEDIKKRQFELECERKRQEREDEKNLFRKEIQPLIDYLKALRQDNKSDYPYPLEKGSSEKYGFRKGNTWLQDPIYYSASSFHYGIALVSENAFDSQYIDQNFNPILKIPRDCIATDFSLGVGIIIQKSGTAYSSKVMSFIDNKGALLFEHSLNTILRISQYDFFPLELSLANTFIKDRDPRFSYNKYHFTAVLKSNRERRVTLDFTNQTYEMAVELSKKLHESIDSFFSQQHYIEDRMRIEQFVKDHPSAPVSDLLKKMGFGPPF